MIFDPYRTYTVRQASAVLKISPVTILRAIRNRKIHSVKIGKQYVLTGQTLLDFMGYKNISLDVLKLENSLIALDLGHNPEVNELSKSSFYNLTAGSVEIMVKEAKTRGELIDKLADFINDTRKIRNK